MPSYADLPKVVLITRETRLKELLAVHHTVSQARFYLQQLGADFDDIEAEDAAYESSLSVLKAELQRWGRYQIIDRQYLPNFIFAEDDIVVVLGKDGTVANTLKYLNGQAVIGINPEATRWDGILLPFQTKDLATLLPDVYKHKRPLSEITMAEVSLSDGQKMLAVNDFFIGARTHTSAFYSIQHKGITEQQSSSGLIVSTGLGSTAWMSSIINGSNAVMHSLHDVTSEPKSATMPWDTEHLLFAVREPFVTKTTSANVVFGEIARQTSLTLRSNMAENGVIFSDGIESDFIRFSAGLEAQVCVSDQRGYLVQ